MDVVKEGKDFWYKAWSETILPSVGTREGDFVYTLTRTKSVHVWIVHNRKESNPELDLQPLELVQPFQLQNVQQLELSQKKWNEITVHTYTC